MYFMVLAWDGTDEGAIARRDSTRAAHTETIGRLFDEGAVLFGAGILDEGGVVRGSLVITDHPNRAAVDDYVRNEPFTTSGVWDRVEVHPLRVPDKYVQHRRRAD
jgi:uncharacterized protein